jgi:phospholipase C
MSYYDGSTLPMWKWAQDYVLADHFFMSAFGDSYLNHFWLVCACTPRDSGPANLRAQLDDRGWLKRAPSSPPSALAGPAVFVPGEFTTDGYSLTTNQPPYQPSRVPPAAGGDPRFADPSKPILSPQTQQTIGDTLSAKGISWAWYAGAWNAAVKDGMQPADAKRMIIYNNTPPAPYFVAHHQPFNYFARFAPGTAERAEHLKDYTDLVAGIDKGHLPAVAFYKPQGTFNEHPGNTDVMSGDIHIAELVTRIKTSPLWSSTAIIVTYDENGGFWDHVPPPKGDRWGPGTRIPAILISPFAKRGYIDHTSYDTTSIIKFITRRFGLEPLAGVRANAGDLTNAFEF